MQIISKIKELQKISEELRQKGKNIAFVPTMGYFHEGHISLMKRAKELADTLIVSLFVNPAQFAPNEDLSKYPRDFERDSAMAETAGVDYLFFPDAKEMYPNGFNTEIKIAGPASKFEGEKRPTHFDGVAIIVAKLFLAANPHIALFGQKDYQQSMVIRKLVKDLNFNINIVVAPTMREADGLAMSSRNKYLNAEERAKAGVLFQALEDARIVIESGERDRKIINAYLHKRLRSVNEIKIDYASCADADDLSEPEKFQAGQRVVMLIAVFLGRTRLIDNGVVSIPAKFPPVADINFTP